AARAGECADRVFLDRRADELELARVELDTRLAEGLAQEERPVEVADPEPVGLRDAIEMIRRDEAAGAGHVLYDERRIAGMCRPMCREITRAYVSNPSGLALVEGLSPGAADPGGHQDRGGREKRQGACSYGPPWLAPAADAGERQLVGPVAARDVPGRDLSERRRLGPAPVDDERTARVEVAARRRIGGIGDLAGQRDVAARRVGIGHGYRTHERGGVRVARATGDGLGGGVEAELAHLHHRHAGTDVLGHREIAGGEEHGAGPPL